MEMIANIGETVDFHSVFLRGLMHQDEDSGFVPPREHGPGAASLQGAHHHMHGLLRVHGTRKLPLSFADIATVT